MPVPDWTPTDLKTLVDDGGAVMAELRADWCTQCGPQEQVVERLAPEYADRVVIGTVDVGEHPEIADRFEVKGLPAFLLFDASAHRTTLNGFKRAPELRQALRSLLSNAEDRKGGADA